MATDSWISDQTSLDFDPLLLESMEQIVTKYAVVPSEKQPKDRSGQELSNLFDSHCHLDRVFNKRFGVGRDVFYQPLKNPMKDLLGSKGPLEELRSRFKKSFNKLDGCISVITHPIYFDKKHWEWMTKDPKIYLAIGCHPSQWKKYDAMAHANLKIGITYYLLKV